MHPILLDLGFTQIHSYGVLGAVGFVVVCVIALTRSQAIGIKPERTADLMFWTAIASLAGARLVFDLQNLDRMVTAFDWINLRAGGLVFYGAPLVGIPVGALLMWRYRMPFFAMWDIFATAFPLAHGFSRVGCLLAGCCYGLPTDLPWAVTYTEAHTGAPLNTPVHPVQLYEAGLLFALGLALNSAYAKRRYPGQIMLAYLVGYAAIRLFTETLRGDAERGFLLEAWLGQSLSFSQGISLGIAAAAILVFGVLAKYFDHGKLAAGAEIRGPDAG